MAPHTRNELVKTDVVSRGCAVPGTRRRPWPWVALLASVMVTGCIGDQTVVNVEPSSIWEATLKSTVNQPGGDLPTLTGQAAVAVHASTSQVGIGVEGADRDLYWGIFEGSCNNPGQRLLEAGSYVVIPPTVQEVEVTLSFTLDPAGSYHIRMGGDAEMEVLLACGNFARRAL